MKHCPGFDSSGLLRLREFCGLAHERQVICIALPPELGDGGLLRDAETRRRCRFQRSTVCPDEGFLEVALGPFENLTLSRDGQGGSPPGVIFRSDAPQTGVIDNRVFSLEVPYGEGTSVGETTGETPGPLRRFRVGTGPWRGRTFLDARQPVKTWRGELLEHGPVRVAYRFRAELSRDGFYEAAITVDVGQPLAVVEERFQAGSGDQVVWDFAGSDLPEEFYLLDASASYQMRPLIYHLDQRLTRLACWTQQSQHFDFSDGYAVGFAPSAESETASREVAGFVALEGGAWRGGKLNHLEAWTRRWFPGDADSRRNVPPEAKADSQPNPERIPARGRTVNEPHFNVEGWIGHGARKWALVLTTLDRIEPPDRSGPPLEHFENRPDRPRYRAQQSLLRRIHTQRGVLPLQDMIGMDFNWETEEGEPSKFAYPNEVLDRHFPSTLPPEEAHRDLMDCLAARVYGFWEGSGSAYTNPVVSRRVAPEMYRYEWLARQEAFSDSDKALVRAWFAFLMHLFASANYYAGDAAMLPVESPDSLDPTLAGMANQNFYTDVFNVPGTGAQVFWKHPRAGEWREFFIRRWHRQLEYHVYPESGLWEESHTYYHHVLHTVLPTFLRRRADGVDDEFANPAFQKLVGAEIHQITPRDACFGGCRHVVIFGDHGVEVELYRDLWHICAEAIFPHDPVLGQALAWVYAEMKGTRPLAVPAKAPEIRNEQVQGLGVMFRGMDAAGQETLLALRGGNAWGHHHNDDGSIQFYAGGRAMIVDAAFGTVQADARRKFEAAGHSRWTLKHADPVNHLWRFNRGWITACALDGPLAFATCYSPLVLVRAPTAPAVQARVPGGHFRTVLQVTPNVYLILDSVDAGQEGRISFHVPGNDNLQITEASVTAAFAGSCGLRILPLGQVSLPRTTLDVPADPQAHAFTTTALEYEAAREGDFSAFLVTTETEGARASRVEKTDSGWLIRSEAFELSLERKTALQWVAIDERTGTSRAFDPRQF